MDSPKARALDDPLVTGILDALTKVAGDHPGYPPVHAKGVMCTGQFTPASGAALQQATAPSANTFVINLKAATYSVSATLPTINTTITIQGTDAATRNIQSASPGHPLLFNVGTGGNLTLDHVTVSNAGHGAISILDGSASITDNAVGGNGGAIFALNVVRAIACTFSGNQSTNGLGGAVFAGANDGAEFDAVNCSLREQGGRRRRARGRRGERHVPADDLDHAAAHQRLRRV